MAGPFDPFANSVSARTQLMDQLSSGERVDPQVAGAIDTEALTGQGEFVKGLRRFGYSTDATTRAFAGQMLETVAPRFSKPLLDSAVETMQRMPQSVRPEYETFEEARKDGLRGLGSYVASTLGEGLPSTALMLASGGIGGGVARLAGARAGTQALARYGAGVTAMTPLEGGETAMQIYQDPQAMANTTPAERTALTSGRGFVNALQENIVPQLLIAPRLMGQAARIGTGLGNAARNTALIGGAGAVGEYGTEVGQDLTGQMALKQARGEEQGDYNWAQANEAGIKGAITGGVTGGVGGAAQALYSNIGQGVDNARNAVRERLPDSPADKFVSALRAITERPEELGADAANMTLGALAKATASGRELGGKAGPVVAQGLDTGVDALKSVKREIDRFIINNVTPENRQAYIDMSERLESMTASEYQLFTAALRAETGQDFQNRLGAAGRSFSETATKGVLKARDWTQDFFSGAAQAVRDRNGERQSLDMSGYTPAHRTQLVGRLIDEAPQFGEYYRRLNKKSRDDVANFLLAARDNPSFFESGKEFDPARQKALESWKRETGTDLPQLLRLVSADEDTLLSPADELKLAEQRVGLRDNRGSNAQTIIDNMNYDAEAQDSANVDQVDDGLVDDSGVSISSSNTMFDQDGNALNEARFDTTPFNLDSFRASMYDRQFDRSSEKPNLTIPVELSSDQLDARQIAQLFGKKVGRDNFLQFSDSELKGIDPSKPFRAELNPMSLASATGEEKFRDLFAPYLPTRPENADSADFSEDKYAADKLTSALAALEGGGIEINPEALGLPPGDPIKINAKVNFDSLSNKTVIRRKGKGSDDYTIGDYTGATKRERGVAAQARLLESFKGNFSNANNTLFKMQATNQTAEAINREAYKRAARIYETNTEESFKDLPKAKKTARINDQIALYAEEVTEKARKQAERRANSEYTRNTLDVLRAAYREGELAAADVDAIRTSIEAGDANARDETIEPTEVERERFKSMSLETKPLQSLAELLESLDMPLPATYTENDAKALLSRLDDMLKAEAASQDRSNAIITGRIDESVGTPQELANAEFAAQMALPEQRANTMRKATLQRAEERDPKGAIKGRQTAKLIRETRDQTLETTIANTIADAKTELKLQQISARIKERSGELDEAALSRLRQAWAAKRDELKTGQQAAKITNTPTFDKLPGYVESQKNMVYAGIGSRKTPPEMLALMAKYAKRLGELGYTLRSGGAEGADTAFAAGAAKKQIFYARDANDQTRAIAQEIHPNPTALGKGVALNLMARNTNQIFGANLDSPADFVLTWTPDGAESTAERGRNTGGTGQAIDMASRKGIPVFNLGKPDGRARFEAFMKDRSGQQAVKTTGSLSKPGNEKQSLDTGAKQSRDTQMSFYEIMGGIAAADAEGRVDTKLLEAAIKSGELLPSDADHFTQLIKEYRNLTSGQYNKGGLAQQTVNSWSRKFADGKPVTVVAIDPNSAIAVRLAWGAGGNIKNIGGVASQIDGRYYIISVKGNAANKSTSLSALAHEFGHILQKIAFNNAPQEVKDKLIAAHKRDVAAFNKDSTNVKRVISANRFVNDEMAANYEAWIEKTNDKNVVKEGINKHLFSEVGELIAADKNYKTYILTFEEWFADQFSKYVTSNGKTLDPELQSLWDKLVENIKRFFNAVIKPLKPSATFKNYVESLVKTEGPVEDLETVISNTIDSADSNAKLEAVGRRIAARSGELSKEATERLREKYKAKKEALKNPSKPVEELTDAQKEFVRRVEQLVGKRVAVLFNQNLGIGVAGSYSSRDTALDRVREQRVEVINTLKTPFADREGNQTDEQLQAALDKLNAEEQKILKDDATLGIIRVATGMEERAGLAEHEAFHGAFQFFFDHNKEDRRVVVTAFSSGIVNRRLREYFKDNQAILDKITPTSKNFDEEETAAYGFQVWMYDPSALKLGENTKTIFEKIKAFFRGLFNIKTHEERALEVLEDLRSGKRAERGTSPLARQLDKNRPWTDRAQDFAKDLGGVIKSGFDMLLSGTYSRLMDFENPAIATIARLGYNMTGQEGEGMVQRTRTETTRYYNELSKITEGMTEEERLQLQKDLVLGQRPSDGRMGRIYDQIKALYADLYQYQTESGMQLGERKDYYPMIWDAEKVLENKEAFLTMLRQDKYKEDMRLAKKTPDEIWRDITAYFDRGDSLNNVMGTDNEPISESSRKRSLAFIEPSDRVAFMAGDPVQTGSLYIKQAVRHAEFVRAYGLGGSRLSALKRDAQKVYGATPDQIGLVNDYIDGLMGNKGVDMSRELKDTYGALVVYQNYRLLPFSLFSSLVDPMGVAVRSNSIGDAWDTFSYSMKNMFNEWKSEYTPDEWETIAADFGIITRAGTTVNADNLYTGVTLRGTTKKLNDAFFKYNLLNGWIRNNHIMATKAAQQFMYRASQDFFKGEGQNQRYLEELGVTKDDIVYNEQLGRILLTQDELEASGMSAEDATKTAAKLRAATQKFVRQALLNPSSAELANWASNPYLAPIAHLKQFVWSFNATIIKRISHELENQNYAPIMMAAAYVPAMIAADFLKDMISNFGEEPPYKKDWDAADYVWQGINRSGLTGTGQFFVDAKEDIMRGGGGYESLAGPSLEQLKKAVAAFGSGDEAAMERWFVKSLPANAVYDQFVLE